MKSILQFNRKNTITVPQELLGSEERFSENFLEYFFELYTKPGEIIFDPFAGPGTSIIVARRMNRKYYGFESNKERCNFVQSQIDEPQHIFNARALNIKNYNIPSIDFSISSPPYTHILSHNNPLRNSTEKSINPYEQFLSDIGNIYNQIKSKLRHKGYCVVEVSNIFDENHNFSPLAWDIAREITKIMPLQQEIIIEWDRSQYGLNHTYCFAFQNISAKSLFLRKS